MNNFASMFFITILTAFLAAACGQDGVVFPDGGSTECGAWYPGSGSDAGTENEIGLKKGNVFPCVVWESARIDKSDTYINIGEEYLKAKHNSDNTNRAIVFFVSADNCPNCVLLSNKIAGSAQELTEAGARLIGVAYTDAGNASVQLSLEEAESILEHEQWPMQFPVANDQEENLRGVSQFFPQLIVVRMSDMKIYTVGDGDFGGNNGYASADELVAAIQGFPEIEPTP